MQAHNRLGNSAASNDGGRTARQARSGTSSTPAEVSASPLQGLKASIEQILRSHPGASLGVCLSAGVLVGWLIKRR